MITIINYDVNILFLNFRLLVLSWCWQEPVDSLILFSWNPYRELHAESIGNILCTNSSDRVRRPLSDWSGSLDILRCRQIESRTPCIVLGVIGISLSRSYAVVHYASFPPKSGYRYFPIYIPGIFLLIKQFCQLSEQPVRGFRILQSPVCMMRDLIILT